MNDSSGIINKEYDSGVPSTELELILPQNGINHDVRGNRATSQWKEK